MSTTCTLFCKPPDRALRADEVRRVEEVRGGLEEVDGGFEVVDSLTDEDEVVDNDVGLDEEDVVGLDEEDIVVDVELVGSSEKLGQTDG